MANRAASEWTSKARASVANLNSWQKAGVAGTGASITAWSIGLSHGLEPHALAKFWVVFIVPSGIVSAGRIPVHLIGGYCSWKVWRGEDRLKRISLDLLVVLNAILHAAWVASGVAVLFWPLIALQAFSSFVIYVAVIVVACAIVEVANSLHLDRGSEIVDDWPLVKFVRDAIGRGDPVPITRPIKKALHAKTPVAFVSAFVVGTSSILLTVAAADAPFAIKDVIDYLNGPKTRLAMRTTTVVLTKTVTRVVTAPPVTPQLPPPRKPTMPPKPVTASAVKTVAGVLSAQTAQTAPMLIATTPTTTSGPASNDCPTGGAVGDPAPKPQSTGLAGLWNGDSVHSGRSQSGGGCPQHAQPVSGHPDVWVLAGMCGTDVRSIGVANASHAVMLFGQMAGVVKSLADAGTLIDVSERFSLGSGDAMIITSDNGTTLAVRASVPPATEAEGPCAPTTDGDVRFAVLPPGLVSLWLAARDQSGHWLWPEADTSYNTSGEFVFRSSAGETVAHGHCFDDTHCTLDYRGQTTSISTGATVAINDVLVNAP
jgi:hypothetical protein